MANNTQTAATTAAPPKGAQRPADKWIWGIFLLLCFVSLIETSSASSREVANAGPIAPLLKHAALLALGVAAAFVIQHINYNRFKVWIPVLLIAALGLVVYVKDHGDMINGARRSISLYGVSLFPSEMSKLAIVAMIALIMSKMQVPGGGTKKRAVAYCAILVALFGGLLYPQGFTNAAILMAISLAMMLIGGVRLTHFLVVLLFYALFYAGYAKYTEYAEEKANALPTAMATTRGENRDATRSNRMANYDFSEEKCLAHPLGEQGYDQEQYGYFARANGGVFGVGPGHSRECSRLQMAHTDFVFSIVVEELGLVGALLLMVAYLALLGRAGSIAKQCRRAFPALLIMGMAVMITVQALSHMAINSGLVPISGQPLPFISKGGSSSLFMGIAMGVMLSVSRYAEFSTAKRGPANDTDLANNAINPAIANK